MEKVLEERGKRYGEFIDNATIAQELKALVRDCGAWDTLDMDQKEAIDNICIKMSRILSPGTDKYYMDNWVDMAGYAELVVNRLEKENKDETVL